MAEEPRASSRTPQPRVHPRPALPPRPAMLPYAKPRETRVQRWLRHKREFLREELAAWRRMGTAVLVGVIFVVVCLLIVASRVPRTSSAILRLIGGD